MATAQNELSPAIRTFLMTGFFIVLASAFSLFILSEQTETFFAWTINPPLTAAFLGAGYAAVTIALALSFRQRSWLKVRVGVSVVLTALILILLATLLHLDRFHLNSPVLIAQLWAWAWLVLYIGLIPGLLIALWMQRRMRLVNVDRTALLAPWLRYAMWILGGVFVGIGAGLFLLPTTVGAIWGWQLTPLTARMIGAWYCSIGTSLFSSALENDYLRVKIISLTYIVFVMLEFINLARYPGTIDWALPNIWLLVAMLGSLLIVGIAGAHGNLARSRAG